MPPDYDPTTDPNSPYYIERRGTAETTEGYRRQAEQDADAAEHSGSFWDQLCARIMRGSRVDGQVQNNLSSDAAMLAQGMEIRPAPAMPHSYYESVEHARLKAMVTDGVDPDAVGQMGALWKNAGNKMVEFQDRIAAAINNSQADWQGVAGDKAREFMANVGNWVGKAGTNAQLAGTQTELQSHALATAKNTMPEPVEFDPAAANARLRQIQDPVQFVQQFAKDTAAYQAQQDNHQQAVTVVSTFDGNLGGSSTMPAFSQPPTMGAGTPPPPSPPPQPPPGERHDMDDAGRHRRVTTVDPHSEDIRQPSGVDPEPGTQLPGFQQPGSHTGAGGTPTQGSPGNLPGGRLPGGAVPGGHFPNTSGFGNEPVGGIPVGGFGGGDTTRGGRGSGGGIGRGFGQGTGQSPGAGPRPGVGGLAVEQAAAGRGGHTAGRGGAPGMGGMGAGAGRGKGGEDEEHQTPSFLVEPDPDAVFGTNEVTAPPVIGG